MNTNKLNILFLINKHKINAKGFCVIMCRMTYIKIRNSFSTGLFVNPEHWNSKKQKVLDKAEQSEYINSQLSLIKTKINRAFLLLQIKKVNRTVSGIYSLFNGEKMMKDYKVLEYFERFLNKLKMLIGIDIKHATWKKFEYVKKHVQSFIKWQYKTKDHPLRGLKLQFINVFEIFN